MGQVEFCRHASLARDRNSRLHASPVASSALHFLGRTLSWRSSETPLESFHCLTHPTRLPLTHAPRCPPKSPPSGHRVAADSSKCSADGSGFPPPSVARPPPEPSLPPPPSPTASPPLT